MLKKFFVVDIFRMIDPLPYVYFGGKRSIAPVVWERLGDVKAYVEPFFGGGAVFWLRPPEHFAGGERRWELLNDIDGMIVNFLRAVYHDPNAVAHYADWHITEVDLTARHIWLVNQKEGLVQRLEADPEYYDAKMAGWWVWGINNWIGGEWCSGRGGWIMQNGQLTKKNSKNDLSVKRKIPQIGNEVRGVLGVDKKIPTIRANVSGILGVKKQMLQVGHEVRGVLGVKKQMPTTQSTASGILGVNTDLAIYFDKLSSRLRGNVCKIVCGDWKRCLTPCCTIHSGAPVGVFLDPPYGGDRDSVYAHDNTTICVEVLNWCKEKGKDDQFRIALCGYTGYYDELESLGWTPYYWSANGGYGNQSQKRGRHNKEREVVWFSPHCLQPIAVQQLDLLSTANMC